MSSPINTQIILPTVVLHAIASNKEPKQAAVHLLSEEITPGTFYALRGSQVN